MAQDLSDRGAADTHGNTGTNVGICFRSTIKTAAWKSKPSWAVIVGNDRAIPPLLEKDEAAAIKSTSITLPANHLAMLSHPREVSELIQQAAAKANRTDK